jgi:hypothetical protein
MEALTSGCNNICKQPHLRRLSRGIALASRRSCGGAGSQGGHIGIFQGKAYRFGGNGTRNDVPWAAEHALEVRAGISA